ncbi:MAG: Two-component system histidine kinase DccS [uncultured Sulfurovum sp.]|uniref:histidine kinase n=1 Tax=uncultured Sulfurovum sp. TaxID=269237 RepID=A0A6S6S0W1_9BACT|nr:MAG: Two-component system histidine kinase DccS [uncultured Sulfurovum sp.]
MKPYVEWGIVLYHDERRALISFLLIYVSSSILMLGSAGFFYYKEKIATIDRMCGVTMEHMAMQVKVHIMKNHDISSLFNESDLTKIGLYDKNKKIIKSNLTTDNINFNQINYTNHTSAFFVTQLLKPINNIEYIIIEDANVSKEMHNLKGIIAFKLFLASLFMAFVGYFLSRLLLKPVKENFAILSRFMKDSAHELNTPVTALMMSANYLKKEYDQEMVEHMLLSSKMISETYNSIAYLAFNDLDVEVNEEFDLAEHIYASIKYFQEIAASKNITINAELNTYIINMDKNSIRKLINNLISNAIKYSYSDKKIDIVLEENILKIKDEGIGINKEDQKKIFKRYKRVDQKGSGGFGIGLDIVMGICRANKIEISLESELKKGSTFSLVFP